VNKAKGLVVLGVTGSIAAYRSCEIVNRLKREGFAVKVIMTKEAGEFITPLTLQTLSQNKVLQDMFALPDEWNPVHTSIAEEARLVLIAPATASIIGKLASGICDDLLSCVVYATKAPVLIAPAMNEKMYTHAITGENIEKLKKTGYRFVGPIKGRLACGYEAIGHIADVETIVKEAKRLVQ